VLLLVAPSVLLALVVADARAELSVVLLVVPRLMVGLEP
jgi:hypothetical protein